MVYCFKIFLPLGRLILVSNLKCIKFINCKVLFCDGNLRLNDLEKSCLSLIALILLKFYTASYVNLYKSLQVQNS